MWSISGELLSVRANITSLAADAVRDDIEEYFKTQCGAICEEEVVVLSAVILGGGKAELTLRGISASGDYKQA